MRREWAKIKMPFSSLLECKPLRCLTNVITPPKARMHVSNTSATIKPTAIYPMINATIPPPAVPAAQ